MAPNFTTLFNTSPLASGDNTIVASGAKTAIRVWKLIVTPGANADTRTLKCTNQGTAYTAKVSVAANGASVMSPMGPAPWAICDPNTALVLNSTTTTTTASTYYTKSQGGKAKCGESWIQLVISQLLNYPLAWARRTINNPEASAIDASRAIDILGRLSEYGWFSKPADPRPAENTISENTAKRILEVSECLLVTCPHCGEKL